MNFINAKLPVIKSLFALLIGKSNSQETLSAESEAAVAVFLPLMALAAGLLAALAYRMMLIALPFTVSALAGLAVLTVLGGFGQIRSASRLFKTDDSAAGAAVLAVLVLLSEAFLFIELGSSYAMQSVYTALIYLPVAGAVAMLAEASAQRTDDAASIPLSGVKGWHMLLSSLLAFVLMLPAFGWKALVLAASSVLAGALTALAMQNNEHKKEAAAVAAIISELLFLMVVMLLQGQSVIYYN